MALDDERGVAALELALLFPIILLVLLIVTHLSLHFIASEAAADGANEALEVLSEVDGSASRASAAAAEVLDADIGIQSWDLSQTGGSAPQVTVTATSPSIVPFLPNDITYTAVGRLEEFIPEAQR